MTDKARIVHVYKDVYPPVEGGIERIIHWLSRLTSHQFDVHVIIAARDRRGGQRELADGVTVTEVPCFGRALSTPLAPGFITALRRSRADLFHFHIPHPTGEAAYILSGLKTPAVATYHSDVVRQKQAMKLYNPIFQAFLRRMAVIMPTSRRYLETSESLAPHQVRCQVVPLGYPLAEYEATPGILQRAAHLRHQYGSYLFFMGCLRAYKGLPYLLRALTHLPQARLLIAGDGAQREALEKMTDELDLRHQVLFLGRVSQQDGVALLHGAAAFVLPAHQRSEAFGLCQIEAMACSLPVISTNLPTGVPEVNADGISGLIVPPADPEALAAAIARLLDDEDLRRQLGQGGHRRFLENYQAETMAEKVSVIYRQVLG